MTNDRLSSNVPVFRKGGPFPSLLHERCCEGPFTRPPGPGSGISFSGQPVIAALVSNFWVMPSPRNEQKSGMCDSTCSVCVDEATPSPPKGPGVAPQPQSVVKWPCQKDLVSAQWSGKRDSPISCRSFSGRQAAISACPKMRMISTSPSGSAS